MSALRLVLGDQLSREISSLRDIDPGCDRVLLVEVRAENTYVRHHRQKMVLVLSAMRHFAEALRAEGIDVDYVYLDDEKNSGSFTGELIRALERFHADRIIVTEPGEWRVWQMMLGWSQILSQPVEIRDDDRFFCGRVEFAQWANERKNLRMESFYRDMRRKTGLLMNGSIPEGGQWNYDRENRKPLPRHWAVPPLLRFEPDQLTRDVIRLVGQHFTGHIGDLEPFGWAVSRKGALEALQYFFVHGLPYFGDYQDAMRSGEAFLFHSVLSPYLNIGLLSAREVCEAALLAYHQGKVPLQAVEGFIRQILGWREYIRGIYWMHMPAYAGTNFFAAARPLPDFYWTGDTEIKCIRETVLSIRSNAYAHHIQRLMVTGNFALLAGIAPAEVEEWYLAVFADAFEWVELPNTHGMALYADGGLLASKPYAASGAYIHRMSDYCTGCAYDPKSKKGDNACPFNYLYWNFLMAHEARLKGNPRMALPYRILAGMAEQERAELAWQAQAFLAGLERSNQTWT